MACGNVRAMTRLAWLLVALAACGTTNDDCPVTLQYITEGILQPSCADAECHSAFARQKGYVFDTVENARLSFQFDTELLLSPVENANLHTDGSYTLINNLTEAQDGAARMPYDAPLPNEDINLIEKWLKAGGPGICGGATAACRSLKGNVGTALIPCKAGNDAFDFPTYDHDQALDPTADICPNGCSNGACL